MKSIIKVFITLSLITVLSASCGNDDDGVTFSAAYGTVEASDLVGTPGRFFSVRLDNGVLLMVMDALVPLSGLVNDDRIVVNYTTLGNLVTSNNETQSYYVRINSYYKLLRKAPIYRSLIGGNTESIETECTLGDDPIKVGDMWLAGRYLNVELLTLREQWGDTKHYMNVVYDDMLEHNEEDGVAKYEFTLRHNAYEDTPTAGNIGKFVFSKGFISFDIAPVMAEQEGKSVEVKIIWYDYNVDLLAEPVRREHSGVFKLKGGRFEEIRAVSESREAAGAYIK